MRLVLLELLESLGIAQYVCRDLGLAHPGTGIGHLGQHLLFMGCVALHGGDQVGHQVGTPLVFVLHLRPGTLDLLVLGGDVVDAATGQGQREGGQT